MDNHRKETLFLILIIITSFLLGFVLGTMQYKSNQSQVQTLQIGALNTQKINLNTATFEELDSLPSIGKKKAYDIIEYRNKSKFKTPYDLLKINGIDSKTVENIIDKVVCY